MSIFLRLLDKIKIKIKVFSQNILILYFPCAFYPRKPQIANEVWNYKCKAMYKINLLRKVNRPVDN